MGTAAGRRIINNYIMRYALQNIDQEWKQHFWQYYFKYA